MFLLDTNVVSELRKAKPHGRVLAWVNATADTDLYLSAVTLGEIQRGIELTRDQNAAKAQKLSVWADRLAATANVLPMDTATFRLSARLMHHQSNALMEDAMIAATALVHRLTVVTRNTPDFKGFDVPLLNPFE